MKNTFRNTVCAALLLLTHNAFAACTTADANGYWRIFASTTEAWRQYYDTNTSSIYEYSFGQTVQTFLRFNTAGNHVDANATAPGVGSATNRTNFASPSRGVYNSAFTSYVSSAKMTITGSCYVTGYIISEGVRYNFQGQMSRDKETIMGTVQYLVGDGVGGPALADGHYDGSGVGTVNMTRY